MRRQIHLLVAACILALGALAPAPAGAQSQADRWDKPIDLKPLIPSFISPLPPKSQLTPGTVGGADNPYTTAPLQNPTRTPTQQAPGIKLSIPTRAAPIASAQNYARMYLRT